MKNNLYSVFIAVTGLVFASLACNMLGSSALIEDDFSDGDTWGTGSDSDHSVKYSNGALQMS